MKLTAKKASYLLSLLMQYRMKPITCVEYKDLCILANKEAIEIERYIKVKYGHFTDGTPAVMLINFWDTEHSWNYDWNENLTWHYKNRCLKQ